MHRPISGAGCLGARPCRLLGHADADERGGALIDAAARPSSSTAPRRRPASATPGPCRATRSPGRRRRRCRSPTSGSGRGARRRRAGRGRRPSRGRRGRSVRPSPRARRRARRGSRRTSRRSRRAPARRSRAATGRRRRRARARRAADPRWPRSRGCRGRGRRLMTTNSSRRSRSGPTWGGGGTSLATLEHVLDRPVAGEHLASAASSSRGSPAPSAPPARRRSRRRTGPRRSPPVGSGGGSAPSIAALDLGDPAAVDRPGRVVPRVDLGSRRLVERQRQGDRVVEVGPHGVAHDHRVQQPERHAPPDRRVRAGVGVGDRDHPGHDRRAVDDEVARAVDDAAHRHHVADRLAVEPGRRTRRTPGRPARTCPGRAAAAAARRSTPSTRSSTTCRCRPGCTAGRSTRPA